MPPPDPLPGPRPNAARPTGERPDASHFEAPRDRGARLFARLRHDIVSATLRPGEALSETRLAEQHGISRTPVRAALQRLADEGLLRVVPQTGSFVAPINLAAVADSQFIREALECRAVRETALVVTEAQRRELRRLIARQARQIEAHAPSGFFDLDEALHRTILAIAGHARVWDHIAAVKAQLDRVRHLSLEDHDWLAMIFDQHRAILDRIEARDAAGAEAAMQQHLRTAFAAIERIAARHPDFFEHGPGPRANGQEAA